MVDTPRSRLQSILDTGRNSIVCGGNREQRRALIRAVAQPARRAGRLVVARRGPKVADELESLGRQGRELLVVFYDAHRISPDLMWAIRSVVQGQHHVIYIFEGSNPAHMIALTAKHSAAFYTQLSVVTLDLPKQKARDRTEAHVRTILQQAQGPVSRRELQRRLRMTYRDAAPARLRHALQRLRDFRLITEGRKGIQWDPDGALRGRSRPRRRSRGSN